MASCTSDRRDFFVVVCKRFGLTTVKPFSASKSLYLFLPGHPIRMAAITIVTSLCFDLFLICVILANCILMTMPSLSWMEEAEYAFLGVYSTEMILKIIACGFITEKYTYLRDPWNRLDFFIVVTAATTPLVGLIGGSTAFGVTSALRAFSTLRTLRTVPFFPALTSIVKTLIRAFAMMTEVLLLNTACLIAVAIFGLQMYMGVLRHKCVKNYDPALQETSDVSYNNWINNRTNWQMDGIGGYQLCGNLTGSGGCRENYTCLEKVGDNPNFGYTNFDHIGWAMLTALQLITLDFYDDIYDKIVTATGPISVVFFVFIFFMSFYLLNLMLAVTALSHSLQTRMASGQAVDLNEHPQSKHFSRQVFRKKGIQHVRKDSFVGLNPLCCERRSCCRRQTNSSPAGSMSDLSCSQPKRSESPVYLRCWNSATWQSVRLHLMGIVIDPLFDLPIAACIFLNTVFLALEHHGQSQSLSEILTTSNLVFTGVFIAEALLKILALGREYFDSGWNRFDFFTALTSTVDVILEHVIGITGFKYLRALRVFRLALLWDTLRILLEITKNSIGSLLNLIFVLAIIIFILATVSLQLFSATYATYDFNVFGEERWHFKDFFHSFMTIFRVLCGIWAHPLWDCMRAVDAAPCLVIWLLVIVIGHFVVLNLFLVLLLNSFAKGRIAKHPRKEKKKTQRDRLKFLVRMSLLCCRRLSFSHSGSESASRNPDLPDNNSNLRPVTISGPSKSARIVSTYSSANASRKPSSEEGRGINTNQSPQLGEVHEELCFLNTRNNSPQDETEVLRRQIHTDASHERNQSTASDGVSEEVGTTRVASVHVDGFSSADTIDTDEYLFKLSGKKRVAEHKFKKMMCEETESMEQHGYLKLRRLLCEGSESMEFIFRATAGKKGAVQAIGLMDDSDIIEVPPDCFPYWMYMYISPTILNNKRIQFRWMKYRSAVLQMMDKKWYKIFILLVIVVGSVALAFKDVYLYQTSYLATAEYVINIVFCVVLGTETILTWFAYGMEWYFSHFFAMFDLLVLIISVTRVTPTLCALRPLCLISRWSNVKIIVKALLKAIPGIVNVFLVIIVIWLFFDILGVQLFAGKFYRCVNATTGVVLNYSVAANRSECSGLGQRWKNSNVNFDNVINGFVALLQLATFEGSIPILHNIEDITQVDEQPRFENNLYVGYLYYFSFTVIGAFFTINFFVGVILDSYLTLKRQYEGSTFTDLVMTNDQRQIANILKRVMRQRPTKQIPPPKLRPLLIFYKLALSSEFELFMQGIVFLNMVVLAAANVNMSDYTISVWDNINAGFGVVYILEAVIKIVGLRSQYFKVPWNVYDFLVVVAFTGDVMITELLTPLSGSPAILQTARIFRLSRAFRLVRFIRGVRRLLMAFAISVSCVFSIGCLLLIVVFAYSVFGMMSFGHVKLTGRLDEVMNFRTFLSSFQLLMRLATAKGWNEILNSLVIGPPDCDPDFKTMPDGTRVRSSYGDCGIPWLATIYIISYIIIVSLIIMNMYIAVILENFNEAYHQEAAGIVMEDLEMFYEKWNCVDPKATHFIPYDQLSDFVANLDTPLRISKPNHFVFIAYDINIYSNDLIHILDVLLALVRYALVDADHTEYFFNLVSRMFEGISELFPTSRGASVISSTLKRKQEDMAARVIQRTYRGYKIFTEIDRILTLCENRMLLTPRETSTITQLQKKDHAARVIQRSFRTYRLRTEDSVFSTIFRSVGFQTVAALSRAFPPTKHPATLHTV